MDKKIRPINYGQHLISEDHIPHLSDGDIEKIVDKVVDRLEKKLYINLGKGILGVMWKVIVMIAIALAGYGAGVHWFK